MPEGSDSENKTQGPFEPILVRSSRKDEEISRVLDAVRDAAAAGKNTMPSLLDAARCDTSVGEMIDTLATVFGRYQQV